MNAKEFLRQVEKLDRLIENKMVEVQQWRAIAKNTTTTLSADRVQSSHNPQKIQDAICKYMDLEAEINRDIDALVDAKSDVLRVIEQLGATDYDVLHKIYVQGLTLQDVASAYDRAYGWATTRHGIALKRVQRILDKRKDTQKP
jgi:DNA-directed RNA polymerase specialized sigma24 family protein